MCAFGLGERNFRLSQQSEGVVLESKAARGPSRFAKPMEPSGLRFKYAAFLGLGWSAMTVGSS
jgi:hypothetical protein